MKDQRASCGNSQTPAWKSVLRWVKNFYATVARQLIRFSWAKKKLDATIDIDEVCHTNKLIQRKSSLNLFKQTFKKGFYATSTFFHTVTFHIYDISWKRSQSLTLSVTVFKLQWFLRKKLKIDDFEIRVDFDGKFPPLSNAID